MFRTADAVGYLPTKCQFSSIFSRQFELDSKLVGGVEVPRAGGPKRSSTTAAFSSRVATDPLASPTFVKIHAEAYMLTLKHSISSEPFHSDIGDVPINTRSW